MARCTNANNCKNSDATKGLLRESEKSNVEKSAGSDGTIVSRNESLLLVATPTKGKIPRGRTPLAWTGNGGCKRV